MCFLILILSKYQHLTLFLSSSVGLFVRCSECFNFALQVPTNILLNMMGVARVRKFVVEEIVRTTLVEYVEKVNSQTHLSITVVWNVAESTMYRPESGECLFSQDCAGQCTSL